ncbi:MAG: Uma2 family endonuclease [Blastocatellia bacterium]|nr:Uma2 family endonuclease [Blastocatellia bacterium]
MAANLRNFYTLAEYFALERVGEARYEYWDGDIVCMSGGSQSHSRLSANLHFLFQAHVRRHARGCEAFTAEQSVKTPKLPPYRYPDVSVVCGESVFEKIQGFDVLVNPVLLVEVVSPTSEERDRKQKVRAYKQIASVTDYLIVAQDRPRITHYHRGSDGSWTRAEIVGLENIVKLAVLEYELPLAEVYERVSFEPH